MNGGFTDTVLFCYGPFGCSIAELFADLDHLFVGESSAVFVYPAFEFLATVFGAFLFVAIVAKDLAFFYLSGPSRFFPRPDHMMEF